jgi:signal transduction histidine kinase
MPFSVYGLEGLFQSGADPGGLRRLLEATLEGTRCFSLPGLLAWSDVARAIGGDTGEEAAGGLAQAIEGAVAARVATLETLGRLQEEFSGLLATALASSEVGGGSHSPTWVPYGAEPWLVGVQTGIETTTTRVAVVRPALLVNTGEGEGSPRDNAGGMEIRDWTSGAAGRSLRFLPAGDVSGHSLGPGLNGLRASFLPGVPPPSDAGDVEAWFFRLLLPIILILTGFTAYLAWRDVKREAEAARLRSQFVSSVTHELKTPLTSIRMFAETLRMGRHAGPEAQQEYLDTVVHETERLSRLINNVLDFARIDRGDKTYRMAPADVAAAAKEAARAVAYPLAQGRHTLVTEIGEDLPILEADSDALTQALLNLLSNAIKFSEEGTNIDLRAFLEGEDLLLQVEDRGRGISSRDQETIFEEFVRAADAEREGIPGTGLGLPLVAHVAEGHGGRVEVESQVGQGSTFTIRIPVERNARGGTS